MVSINHAMRMVKDGLANPLEPQSILAVCQAGLNRTHHLQLDHVRGLLGVWEFAQVWLPVGPVLHGYSASDGKNRTDLLHLLRDLCRPVGGVPPGWAMRQNRGELHRRRAERYS